MGIKPSKKIRARKGKESKFGAEFKQAYDYFQSGSLRESLALCHRILQAEPGHDDALLLLGLLALQNKDYEQAAVLLEQAVNTNPKLPTVRFSYAQALSALGLKDRAIDQYRACVALNPKHLPALNFLGVLLNDQELPYEAWLCFKQANQCQKDNPAVLSNLGMTLSLMGEHAQAVEYYEQSHQVNPLRAVNVSNLLLCYNYADLLTPEQLYLKHQSYTQKLFKDQIALAKVTPFRAKSKIHIGYVSSDMHRHSVPYFFLPLIEHHDRMSFKTIVYYNNTYVDQVTQRIRANVDEFKTIADQSTLEVQQLVEQDEVDILVDLTGHMRGNRLDVIAAKVAPVQVSWLGYPNTTGLAQMDYRLTDAIADPEGLTDAFYTEALIRLNKGFLVYRGDAEQDYRREPPALSNGYVTFGSFNSCEKITPKVVEVWAQILGRVADSKLILKSWPFQDKGVRKRFLALFAAFGIATSRIQLLPFAATANHLETYNLIDLALDTFPYNGTTTTCEALWMGVPTVTYAGSVHAGRVGASILHRVDLDEFVAANVTEYVELALGHAADLKKLTGLRVGLRERLLGSDLGNAQQFAQQVETVFRAMLAKKVEQETSTDPSL